MHPLQQLLACALWAASACVAAQGRSPELPESVAPLRQRGCTDHAGTAQALDWAPQLAETARRVARGEPSLLAAREAGYRSRKVYVIRLSGYASAQGVARMLGLNHCESVTDPQFTGAGFHREGNAWWIVLASLHKTPGAGEAPDVAARVLVLTNEARSKPRSCGGESFGAAPPLRPNALLERAALLHAQDMSQNNFLAHEGRDGSTVGQRLDRAGYRWRAAGENVASGQGNAEEVVRDWLRSPHHCSSIMNPAFTDMGVAFAVDLRSESGIHWAQEFGRPR